jgi:hypothetical protein
MLVEEIDHVRPQSPQASFRRLPDVRRPAVDACLFAVLDPETEFRGNDDALAQRGEGLADELFVDERPVHLSGIEKRNTPSDSVTNQGHR